MKLDTWSKQTQFKAKIYPPKPFGVGGRTQTKPILPVKAGKIALGEAEGPIEFVPPALVCRYRGSAAEGPHSYVPVKIALPVLRNISRKGLAKAGVYIQTSRLGVECEYGKVQKEIASFLRVKL